MNLSKSVFMMKNLLRTTFFILLCASVLVSCKTTKVIEEEETESPKKQTEEEQTETWAAISSVEQLLGLWQSEEKDVFEFPAKLSDGTVLESGGERFLRVTFEVTTDSQLWAAYASMNKMSFEDLWSKRFSYIKKIYKISSPIIAENGVEFGLRLSRKKEIECSRNFLIPESLVKSSLSFFELSSLGSLRVSGTLYLNSEVFSVISLNEDGYFDDRIFKKADKKL